MGTYNSSFVFCLAGLGQRFLDAGITIPKYLLCIDKKGTTLLEESIRSLNINKKTFVLLICNKKHKSHKDKLNLILEDLDIKFKILYIENTNGQAITAFNASKELIAKEYLKKKPVIFFNGDTILKTRNINTLIRKMGNSDGLIDIFLSNKPCYSFIKTNGKKVINIVEKKVISDDATSGLYFFSSPSSYIDEFIEGNFLKSESEVFISDIYKYMIKKGQIVKFSKSIHSKDTQILGTPEEYFKYMSLC
tara:strand:- start:1317 stop:2063 length:747 start_codon:yes stop_codon:yes gene_type:complete